jgi:hypothetical protein
MSRCESCSSVMSPKEMFRTVEIEDGRTMEIVDNLCSVCIGKYIYGIDALDSHFYACSDNTEYLIEGISCRNTDNT